MGSRTVIWICLLNLSLVLGYEYEVFDTTTIYDLIGWTGRVHSRTNALGLPLFNGSEIREISVKPNISCDSVQNRCDWTLNNWDLTPSSLPTFNLTIPKENFIELKDNIEIKLKKVEENHNFNFILFFTSKKSLRDCEGFHEIKIANELLSETFSASHRFCSCTTVGQVFESIRDGIDRYGYSKYKTIYCEEREVFKLSRSALIIQLEGGTGKLSLLENKSPLKVWSGSMKLNYLYVKGDSKGIQSILSDESGKAYTSVSEVNEMVSQVIHSEEGTLCLTLVLHVPSYTEESVLDIYKEDLSAKRTFLDSVKQVSPGWNRRNITINFPSRSTGPFKLVIKSTNEVEIKIARIASFSCEGNEVEIISHPMIQFYSLSQFDANIFSATAYGIQPAERQGSNDTSSSLCMNGGVYTTAGCACLPGFYGPTCQSGCGRNRYGQDCNGLCSVRQKECLGLFLCTYSTGCHCAPGYHGSRCFDKCSDGYYGNDCQQHCGHCAAGAACDIYTGECSSCEFGYLPPTCNKESVYYSLPPQLSSPEYGEIMVSFHPELYTSGVPTLYQIQYKEEGHDWKTYITKKYPVREVNVRDHLESERVEGLQDGVVYKVRLLLMDEDFNKYDGDLVQVSGIVTKCDIPEEYDYKVIYESDSSSLNFSWSYIPPISSHWCPVEWYEASWKEDWQWFTQNVSENNFQLNDLFSGSTIKFRVRAKTSGGFSPYSDVVKATTKLTEISAVRNLNAKSRTSSSVEVSWEPPIERNSKELQYTVVYKCVDRPACSPGCQTASEGRQTVHDNHITIHPLLPFTQYKVTVTPEDGQPATVYVGTSDVVPTEVPTLSGQRPVRTNTSVTVFWEQVPVCSSFFQGYNYQLTKESESLKILESGFTNNNSATFHNLTASTQYVVKVFISTIAGWNPGSFLAINVSTSATVPEAVRNLTVYKRGRGMLGLRWAEPRATYGQLKSFTVTHSLGQEVVSHTVEPSRCVVWPELYCHTIEGLRSNRRYNVSVSARNSEVAEDGQSAFDNAVTKESPPSAPVNLKVTNMTSTSIELEWNYPDMANGIVRSFLIGVEETEKYDQDSCCQIYPFVETLVKEESKTYTAEVSGLHPASTYFVTVSAKTVGLGPSQSLVVSTRPPHLPLTSLPNVQEPEVSWQPQDKLPEVNNSDIYTSLVRATVLLAVPNENQSVQFAPESRITDTKLDSLLQQRIGKPFYFIAEYNQDDDVDISGYPLEDNDSPWGRPPASLSPEVVYQLVATQVLEYNGVYNVDLRYSLPFTLYN